MAGPRRWYYHEGVAHWFLENRTGNFADECHGVESARRLHDDPENHWRRELEEDDPVPLDVPSLRVKDDPERLQ